MRVKVRRRKTVEAHQHINQDSGDTEYYTPQVIIERARRLMGGIYLDPASSAEANKRVRAKKFFTKENNGLTRKWEGRVWMNHPFSRQGNKEWIRKLVEEYEAGNIEQACCITFAATSEAWFAPLMQYPQCYLRPRTNYHKPDGTLKVGVTKGSVVTYLGLLGNDFYEYFDDLGSTMVPMGLYVS